MRQVTIVGLVTAVALVLRKRKESHVRTSHSLWSLQENTRRESPRTRALQRLTMIPSTVPIDHTPSAGSPEQQIQLRGSSFSRAYRRGTFMHQLSYF